MPRPTNLRRQAYDQIRQQILDARLPPGSPISEYQLSAAMHISRTPVREALRMLEREGLVLSVPSKGTFVAELSPRDIHEIYQVREQLEAFAARVSAERMDPKAAESLEDELEAAMTAQDADPVPAFEADIHLHKQLIAVTDNRRLEQILRTLDDQVHIIRHLAPSAPGRLQQMTTEHLKIVRAIRRRSPAEAEQAMREHLRSAQANALRVVLPMGFAVPGTGRPEGDGITSGYNP